jgi:MFS transporter, ACS family, glucarate transporter
VSHSSPLPVPSAVASRTRYKVVGWAVALAMVTYLDRACLATLAPDIMRDLGLSKQQMGVIYSAFALAYAAFEIPTAWWADRFGTRLVLTRIVVWWSAFTMATAAAFNFVSLVVLRFLFGAGEAGAWPSVARTFSRWIPRSERGRIQGIFFAGAHLAGGVTPLIAMLLLQVMSWRAVFVVFGALGLVWALGWYRWFRDEPADHPQVNAAELARILANRPPEAGHGRTLGYWRRLFGQRNVLFLCLMYLPNSYAFYFCITWLPTYLREKHGFSQASLAVFAGLPLIFSVLGDLLGGVATDAVTARFGLRVGRAAVGGLAYLAAGAAMIGATLTAHPMLAGGLIATAVGASMFTLAPAWGTCQDIGGNHAGVVSAAMNTAGQVGSILSPLMVTYLLTRLGDWNAPLLLMGGLFLIGALAWSFIDPRQRVFDP